MKTSPVLLTIQEQINGARAYLNAHRFALKLEAGRGDEAAGEHYAEMGHVLDAIDAGKGIPEILEAADYVGLRTTIVLAMRGGAQ